MDLHLAVAVLERAGGGHELAVAGGRALEVLAQVLLPRRDDEGLEEHVGIVAVAKQAPPFGARPAPRSPHQEHRRAEVLLRRGGHAVAHGDEDRPRLQRRGGGRPAVTARGEAPPPPPAGGRAAIEAPDTAPATGRSCAPAAAASAVP